MNSFETKQVPGVWPVVLTAFGQNGSIDFNGYGKLLDWYIGNGAAGLFAVCLSSELYALSAAERLELARFTVKHGGGKLPVVACGGLGATLAEMADSVKAMADTGVDAVILPAALLCGPAADETEFERNFTAIVRATPGIKLGIYEIPLPYHRRISPASLKHLVELGQGRLTFLKDTCCDAAVIRQKLAATAGSNLQLYNANITTLWDSLRAGAAGFSGIAANFYPGLLAKLCQIYESDPALAKELQQFFNAVNRAVEFKYPRGAKLFIRECGVEINDYCRVGCEAYSAEQLAQLKDFKNYLYQFAASH